MTVSEPTLFAQLRHFRLQLADVVLCRFVVLGTGDFSLDVGYLLGEGHVLRQKWDVMKPLVGPARFELATFAV